MFIYPLRAKTTNVTPVQDIFFQNKTENLNREIVVNWQYSKIWISENVGDRRFYNYFIQTTYVKNKSVFLVY